MGLEPLSAWDYVVFAAMLILSTGIGIYYALSGGRQKTQGEFLMANKSMGVFPVTLSLLASFMSAITLLGTPATMYLYGTQYWIIGPCYVAVCGISAHVFLPVFYNLQITSVYEYLELRFSRCVRLLGCFTFLVQMLIYMGIVLYAPALALSAVTGLNWIVAVVILGSTCTLYTTIIMFCGMLAVGIQGSLNVGGFDKVWEIYGNTSRLNLWNFEPDPTERHTVWCLVIGGTFTWLVIYGVNQTQVQRYLTCPTLRQAQMAIWLNLPGLWGLLTVCAFTGIVAFSYFYEQGCDPLHSKQYIKKSDQILPLFVMEAMAYPGFRGLFIATIFSGALSTISSGVNALAAVTLEDLVKPIWHHFRKTEITDEDGAKAAKGMAAGFGVMALGLAFVASKMGDVLSAALGLFGMVGGPLLGVFFLGILFPAANWQVMSLWVGFGAFIDPPPKESFSYNNSLCPNTTTTNVTTTPKPIHHYTKDLHYDGLVIYRISYMWQGAWAVAWTIIAGLLISMITGWKPKSLRRPEHVFSVADTLCCCLPSKAKTWLRGTDEVGDSSKDIQYGQAQSVASIASSNPSTAYNNRSFKPDSSSNLSKRTTPV